MSFLIKADSPHNRKHSLTIFVMFDQFLLCYTAQGLKHFCQFIGDFNRGIIDIMAIGLCQHNAQQHNQ